METIHVVYTCCCLLDFPVFFLFLYTTASPTVHDIVRRVGVGHWDILRGGGGSTFQQVSHLDCIRRPVPCQQTAGS